MSSNQMDATFDLLLQEIDSAIEDINGAASKALNDRKYDQAASLAEKGAQASSIHKMVEHLRQECSNIFAPEDASKKRVKKPKGKRKKLKPGLLAPMESYRVPILQALIQLGGSGSVREVEDLVEENVQPILTEYDCLPIDSNPNLPRWRNRTEWVRWELVQEGLLSSDSPRGIWEITQEGRDWLAKQLKSSENKD